MYYTYPHGSSGVSAEAPVDHVALSLQGLGKEGDPAAVDPAALLREGVADEDHARPHLLPHRNGVGNPLFSSQDFGPDGV